MSLRYKIETAHKAMDEALAGYVVIDSSSGRIASDIMYKENALVMCEIMNERHAEVERLSQKSGPIDDDDRFMPGPINS